MKPSHLVALRNEHIIGIPRASVSFEFNIFVIQTSIRYTQDFNLCYMIRHNMIYDLFLFMNDKFNYFE